jgi:hypothetical protein
VPTRGLWDTAIDMHVVYQFKNPDWTLEWGQPGNKVGQTEFGNVFWGDRGRLILEWEGGYRPANPEAISFQLPPGGREVYRTDEYEDFNMNHKADWFKSIREGHLRPELRQKFCYLGGGAKPGEMIRCAKSNCYPGGNGQNHESEDTGRDFGEAATALPAGRAGA